MKYDIQIVSPNDFEQEKHFYPKALNAQMHPMVNHFFNLDHERIISRYVHLHPKVDSEALRNLLKYRMKHFYWAGSDLFYVTTEAGNRKMVVLETNSCPSGQKSMPLRSDMDEFRGYRNLIENSFIPAMKGKRLPHGALAVIFDKNYMEASGYAAAMAEATGEQVYLIPYFDGQESNLSFEDGVIYLNNPEFEKTPIKAALRYVTQRPWNRFPIVNKTMLYNSVLVDLAGGRNKLVASKAYEIFNSSLGDTGLQILFPETIRDVNKVEIPLWVTRFGGAAVIKVPYSNAGQGVYTITNESELETFMERDLPYDQYIVQSLIGHYNWSSVSERGKFYHIGTVPNKKGKTYVADLRMMIISTPDGIKPAAIYARRAASPMGPDLTNAQDSWEVLGTNLSIKMGENLWDSDTNRLLLMDRKDFNTLGVGLDDIIEAFIQTVLSVTAIDQMAINLLSSKGTFRKKLFRSLDNDPTLLSELYQ